MLSGSCGALILHLILLMGGLALGRFDLFYLSKKFWGRVSWIFLNEDGLAIGFSLVCALYVVE
jgi:hypothetical protein